MAAPANLRFLGAAGTVTGSKHLLTASGAKVLLDRGLFQGLKELRLRNWSEPPFEPRELDGVVLSHAHIDHSGYLPVLVRRGYRGPVCCTPATADLLRIMLLDSARLQEEEAGDPEGRIVARSAKLGAPDRDLLIQIRASTAVAHR